MYYYSDSHIQLPVSLLSSTILEPFHRRHFRGSKLASSEKLYQNFFQTPSLPITLKLLSKLLVHLLCYKTYYLFTRLLNPFLQFLQTRIPLIQSPSNSIFNKKNTNEPQKYIIAAMCQTQSRRLNKK